MRRQELCTIAGMNPSTFNVHRMKGDLPFEIEHIEGQDELGRKWAQFTIHHAAMLIAARQLVAQGVAWSEACRILRDRHTHTPGGIGPGKNYYDIPGVFVARVMFLNGATNGEPELMPSVRLYRGPLASIIQAATSTAANYSAERGGKEAPVQVAGMVAVDISHCFNLAHLIAADKGIKVAVPADPAEIYADEGNAE